MTSTADTPEMAGLKAVVVGRVEHDGSWSCECGEHGQAADDTAAALALYWHRRVHHLPVVDAHFRDANDD